MENKQKLLNIVGVLAILLSVYVLVLAVKEWKSLKYVGGQNSQGYITVSGEGEVMAVPDVATFTFSANEVAKTVNVARDAATLSINKALDVVKKAGVEEKDIKTIEYSINPKYEYTYNQPYGGKQVFVGYEVNQTVEVKVRDLNKVGQLFADVSAIGIKNLGNVAFSVDAKDSLKEQARSEAIEKARAQAKALAKDLGVSLIRISSFNENGSYPMPYYAKGGMMEMSAVPTAAPSVPVGEQKIVSNVSITYEIR